MPYHRHVGSQTLKVYLDVLILDEQTRVASGGVVLGPGSLNFESNSLSHPPSAERAL